MHNRFYVGHKSVATYVEQMLEHQSGWNEPQRTLFSKTDNGYLQLFLSYKDSLWLRNPNLKKVQILNFGPSGKQVDVVPWLFLEPLKLGQQHISPNNLRVNPHENNPLWKIIIEVLCYVWLLPFYGFFLQPRSFNSI